MSDLSVKEASGLFGVCEETVRRMIVRGEIKAYRVGGGPLRITHESIADFRNQKPSKRRKTGPKVQRRSTA